MGQNLVLTLAVGFLVPFTILYYRWASGKGLHAIPTIGPSAPGLSYIGAFRAIKHAKDMVQEGYYKYKGGAFKIALIDRWVVVVSGSHLIEEIRKMPDDMASFMEAACELVQIKYTLGTCIQQDPYHIEIIRSQLTRNIANFFPVIREEIVAAFSEMIPVNLKEDSEWTSVPALQVMGTVVARVSNRVFLGLPLCRNPEYLDLAVRLSLDVAKTRSHLTLFPNIFKLLAVQFQMINPCKQSVRHGVRLLKPMIEQRFQQFHEHGENWSGKPDDALQWFVDEALERKESAEDVVRRVLLLNFVAIHTSSNSFTHALFHLAANPEYLEPLREEVEQVVEAEGWTKTAMNKLRKLDSFMKESQRLNGVNCTSLTRKVLTDITLSNGTFIPAGTICVAASAATHTDDENYDQAHVFDPFRFSDMREEDGEGTSHQFVSTSANYIPFGHGKQACPGRFFAANELKAMMAHLVVTYDVKFENEGVRPPNQWFAVTVTPSPTARVLFRKRKV